MPAHNARKKHNLLLKVVEEGSGAFVVERLCSEMEEEEDLGDYDDDFDWDDSEDEEEAELAPPPLQIKGREVDPNAEEEVWDEDFEFGDSSEGEILKRDGHLTLLM